MKPFRLRILAQTLPFLLITPGLALAQNAPTRHQATAALNQPAKPGAQQYTRQQIDQMVAPIALYPDQLLSQVLMAATYPQQVVEAAQWLQGHPDMNGDGLVSALEPLPWDPSVKALAAFPQIIVMMSDHIEWTEALGVAFVTQQAEVMARVQALRHLAMKSGQIGKVKHLAVRQQGQAIVITSAEPDKIYVPVYNPTVVYGQWQDREFPPVFLPPPQGFVAETIEPGFEVSRAYSVVRPLWGWSEPDWRANRITVNSTEYTRITRNVEVGPGNTWRHAGPVMLVSPGGTVSRSTTVTTNVPAGTVLPGRAAAVTVLPQRAAAQPQLIQTQTTTTQSGQPGQSQTTTVQPGQTGTTTTSQPGQTNTTQTNTSQPGQTPSTTTAQPSGSQPGQPPTNTAQPSTSQPSQTPSTTAAQPSANKPGEARSTTNPASRESSGTEPGKSQATTQPGKDQAGRNERAAGEKSGQSAKPEAATKPSERHPGANQATTREHEKGQGTANQGTATSPTASQPRDHGTGSSAAKPDEPTARTAPEHGPNRAANPQERERPESKGPLDRAGSGASAQPPSAHTPEHT
ncbi:MAG TPA: DUF3300 domain-containing protein, partial [Gaiellales bacterium]|nr:DUF3300 domain-containing protein [Gaiellales bacterium]